MTSMQWTVSEIMQDRAHPGYIKKISKEEYLQWARGFVFEGLKNQRYGQSFCNHFDIHDNILYYSSNVTDADRYIQETYLR